ncbi:MAG: glycosyltransferase family 2 protein [Bacteroidia bacterium]|nr:glycosyltransferase family 2 protein [Bacteroidia bacterium]
MKICTIVVSYNFEKWLHTCLPSLQNSSVKSTVLVIDNASSDNTCDIIIKDYPEVVLLQNHKNMGFGKANNLGMRYALDNKFDYVFLLNQDAWVEPDTIEKLIEASSQHPEFGIISPIHLNGSGEKLDFGFSNYTNLKNKEEALNLSDTITTCKFINAAAWLIPVPVVKKVGGFAAIFPHYGEDVNYSQRVRKQKLKTGFVKDAFVYHHREFREIDREKFFYSEYIYFLTEAVNPLYSPMKAFAYSVLAAKKKSLISLFSGKFNDCARYANIIFQITGKAFQIKETRKNSKKQNAPFL